MSRYYHDENASYEGFGDQKEEVESELIEGGDDAYDSDLNDRERTVPLNFRQEDVITNILLDNNSGFDSFFGEHQQNQEQHPMQISRIYHKRTESLEDKR